MNMVDVGYLVATIGMGRHLYETRATNSEVETYAKVCLPILLFCSD